MAVRNQSSCAKVSNTILQLFVLNCVTKYCYLIKDHSEYKCVLTCLGKYCKTFMYTTYIFIYLLITNRDGPNGTLFGSHQNFRTL